MEEATLRAKVYNDHILLEELLERQAIKPGPDEARIREYLEATRRNFAECFPNES